MASEAALRERCRRPLSQRGHWQRIETGAMGDAGVPDVNYCFAGAEGWVELKQGDVPKRESTVVFKSQRGLEPAQIDWLLYRRKCGGRAFVLVQLGSNLYLIDGFKAARFNHWLMCDFQLEAEWWHEGAMRESDWDALVNALSACTGGRHLLR